MKRKEKGNTRSIRALVNPRHITMVSVALLAHRSSRGKDGFVHESKEIKHRKGKSMQIEKEKKFQTLTLEMKGRGTYLARAPLPPPVRGTRLRRRSPDFTAQRSRRLAAPGRRGRARGAREHGSVHGRLDGGALPSGERAHRRASRGGAASPAPPGHPWPPPCARGKGEGENEP
jgi:hypothetical protein